MTLATGQPPRYTAADKQGVVLGIKRGGEHALPMVGARVVLSKERLCRHLLVCGATGSGKTETVLRVAWAVAKGTRAPVFYLDGKGDRRTAKRFVGLMKDAGRQTRVFPNEPLDGWRGEAHEIKGRLMEIVDYATTGGATWYRDLAKVVLSLTCQQPSGAPKSSRELLARMDLDALKRVHGEIPELLALSAQQVNQVRLRYAAFFGETRGALDGDTEAAWAWEDTQAAYLLLDSLRLREETGCLARFLLEDFAHYFTSRKPPGEWALLVVDEFSALAEAAGMARCIEQARGFDTALVLVPQVVAGMGEQADARRILGSVETVICHRVNTPEELVALAGTRPVPELSTRFNRAGTTGEGSIQQRHHYKIDPNRVRGLPEGEAFLISRGRAMHTQILRAPQLEGALPGNTAVPADAEPSEKKEEDPKEEDPRKELPW
jgi:conjugal transfer pilus assembly protein TraD